MTKTIYKIKEKVWIYPGPAPWHFVTLSKDSKKIRQDFGHLERGWRSLRVLVQVGKTKWNTSMFWDSDEGGYILPIKAGVRKKENIFDDDVIKIALEILV